MGAIAKGQQRGFTLVEALAVLAIVLVAAAFAYRALDARNKGAVAESFILSEARELKELAAAARSYAAQNKASWVANTTYFAYIAQLSTTTPPLLPTTWAQRGGTAGLTPIGETYRAIFRKDSSGVVRIVITDYGSGIPSSDVRIRQAGYLKTAASLDGYKLRVADQYAKLTDGGYSGVVAANTMSARAPGGGFTQDLTAYFNSTAPTYPVAVVLVGWPEYPDGGDEGDSFNGTCSISVGQNPTCPIGSVEADRWNACTSAGYVSRTASNGVRFAFGSEQKYVKNDVPCNYTCSGEPWNQACQSLVPATSFNEVYAVEGLRVSEVICSVEYPRNDSPSPPYSCGIQTGVWRPSWSAYYTGTIPKAILCCSGG